MDYKELLSLIVSWAVISFLFSLSYLFTDITLFYTFLPLAAASAGAGFLLHELAHRTVARGYGCIAYYQVWMWGIVASVAIGILTSGQFIFAALGAVYITPVALSTSTDQGFVKRAFGLISLSGAAMNLLLAAIFFVLLFVGLNSSFLLAELGYIGVLINLWLASFNLLPIPPLDGSKVFGWSKLTWAAFAIPAWALTLLWFYFPSLIIP